MEARSRRSACAGLQRRSRLVFRQARLPADAMLSCGERHIRTHSDTSHPLRMIIQLQAHEPGESDYLPRSAGDAVQSGWHHVCFRVVSADETIKELKQRGVKVVGEPQSPPGIGIRFAFFVDPWGNRVEVLEQLEK